MQNYTSATMHYHSIELESQLPQVYADSTIFQGNSTQQTSQVNIGRITVYGKNSYAHCYFGLEILQTFHWTLKVSILLGSDRKYTGLK